MAALQATDDLFTADLLPTMQTDISMAWCCDSPMPPKYLVGAHMPRALVARESERAAGHEMPYKFWQYWLDTLPIELRDIQ